MKINLKSMSITAGAFLIAQVTLAQINVNGATNVVTKTTVSANRVGTAVTKTSEVTGRVVQNTGKIVQNTTTPASKAGANLNAVTNVNATTQKLNVKSETSAAATVSAETNGKSQLVKEVVVSEAKEIRDMPAEMVNEIKPGSNLKSETSTTGNVSTNNSGVIVNGETSSQTESNVQPGVNADKTKEKISDTKENAKSKASNKASKVKKAKVKANVEASATSQTSASSGRQ